MTKMLVAMTLALGVPCRKRTQSSRDSYYDQERHRAPVQRILEAEPRQDRDRRIGLRSALLPWISSPPLDPFSNRTWLHRNRCDPYLVVAIVSGRHASWAVSRDAPPS